MGRFFDAGRRVSMLKLSIHLHFLWCKCGLHFIVRNSSCVNWWAEKIEKCSSISTLSSKAPSERNLTRVGPHGLLCFAVTGIDAIEADWILLIGSNQQRFIISLPKEADRKKRQILSGKTFEQKLIFTLQHRLVETWSEVRQSGGVIKGCLHPKNLTNFRMAVVTHWRATWHHWSSHCLNAQISKE